jgi:hypothetical protein
MPQACFLWEGNGTPVFRARVMSYREVLRETCRVVRSFAYHHMECPSLAVCHGGPGA